MQGIGSDFRQRCRGASVEAISASGSKVRVAIVAASPRWVGGQSVQAGLLMRNWQGDPEVEASLTPIDPNLPAWLAWVERVPFLRTFMRTPWYLRALWQVAGEVQILHIFSASYWSFLIATAPAWLVGRLRHKRALIHYHSGEAADHLRRSWVARWVLGQVDSLIVPSGYLVEVFREFGLHAEAIPNVVDLDQFIYRGRDPLRPLLVCTRGFHRYYSVDHVVRAFAAVKKQFSTARLCLVGNGPDEEKIRTLVGELQLTDVDFTGTVSRQAISRYYEEADIFINASWLDNSPVSLLEAFASGTPVVTTAPEGIQYMVEHERTGLLCQPGDWQALAQNVVRLLREAGLGPRLAENARQELPQYEWVNVRRQWLEVYQSSTRAAKRERPLETAGLDVDGESSASQSPEVGAGFRR